MEFPRNAFAAMCVLASAERWCWKIHCTTCAHGAFRCGLFELGLGRHPAASNWITRRQCDAALQHFGGLQAVTRAVEQSESLYEVLSDAPVEEIATGCRFPDYLGYLGLALLHARQLEHDRSELTRRWSEQLLRLVDETSAGASMLRRKLASEGDFLQWQDLEQIENDMLSGVMPRR